MSYSNQFRGSPWQPGGYAYDVNRYGQAYGGYGFSMMNAYSQERYSSAFGSGGVSSSRSMGYSLPSGYYLSDRTSGYQNVRGQIQQKRLSQRMPAGGPRPKRLKLENNSRQDRRRGRWRKRRNPPKPKQSNKSDNKSGETADISNTENGYDSWKSSDDENETAVTDTKDQQSANDVEKTTEKTDESDKTKDSKIPLACHVCKVKCSSLERFGNHMTSRTHRVKMEKLLVLQKEKNQVLEASTKASQQVKSRDRLKKDGKKRRDWCTVCEVSVPGQFFSHRRTVQHKKNRDKKFPKCRPCAIGFTNAKEYKEHCSEKSHKMKSAEFYYRRNLASGSDDDAAAIEPVKLQSPVLGDPKLEGEQSTATKETEPFGLMFVVQAKGHYCKLCRKFFKDSIVARVKHCRSKMHSEAFKKAMKEAMEQEEERQKLAEEQEKLEEKAAAAVEEAHTDAQIAAVEKTGEESKMETNEKNEMENCNDKKEMENANDSESQKSSDQSGNAVVVKMEVSDIVDVANKEDANEVKGNAVVVKMEVSDIVDVANKEDANEVKATIEEGKPHETAQLDQKDKECEDIKKESPGSRGGRRSRGRGRRR